MVVFIFKEDETPLNPSTFVSDFNHVFLVIHKTTKAGSDATHYRLSMTSKNGVHSYVPVLPHPAIFEKNDRFKRLTLSQTLCPQLERRSPYFGPFRTRCVPCFLSLYFVPFSFPSSFFCRLLMFKAINSERSGLYAPCFVDKLSQSRKILLNNLVSKHGTKGSLL